MTYILYIIKNNYMLEIYLLKKTHFKILAVWLEYLFTFIFFLRTPEKIKTS